MKKLYYLIAISFLIVGLSQSAEAQWMKKLGEKAGNAAKRGTEKAVEKKVEQKVEEKVGEAVEGVIDEITDPDNFKSSDDGDSDNNSTENQEQEPAKPKAPPVECKPVSASSKSVPASAKDKKYPFEQGTIYQQSSAMGFETNPVIYFDKYGDWTAQETIMEMKVLWKKVKTHSREIVKGAEHWSLDIEEKKGTHYTDANIKDIYPLADVIAEDIAKDIKVEELGEVDYLGYRCTKQRITSAENQIDLTAVIYGNLSMQTEGTVMGIPVANYVTKIDLSTPPKNIFEVPSDIKITEVTK